MARQPRPTARSELPLLQLIPNILTLGAICAGLTAIRFAVNGDFRIAVALIILAAAIDGVDGRIARILKSESALGAELDSLADFLNFGVAPALMLYFWTLDEAGGGGWIAALVYACCCVMRLARFNVGNRKDAQPQDKRFFTGVPAPAGAMLALLPVFLNFTAPEMHRIPSGLVAIHVIIVGGLMISRLPTYSFKTATIYADYARLFLVLAAATIALLVTYPWVVLTVFDLVYLAGIPVAVIRVRREKRKGAV